MELWIRPTAGSGVSNGSQIFTAGFINCSINAYLDTNRLFPRVGNGSTWTDFSAYPAADLDDGSWHYIAMVYDGAELSVWVDGEVSGSLPAVVSLADPNDYKVGGRPQNTFLTGDMDEIRLSHIARTADEIADAWMSAPGCAAP